MEKLLEWVKRYQVVAFFVLTFLISWGLWLPFVPIVFGRGMVVFVPLFIAGVFVPALAGITIYRLIHPSPLLGIRKLQVFSFFLTWCLATVIFALYWAESARDIDLSPELIGIAAITALVPAFIVSSAFSRVPGVRNYLHTLVNPRGRVYWYVAAILISPVLILLSTIISRIFGLEIPPPMTPVDFGKELIAAVVLSSGYGFSLATPLEKKLGGVGLPCPGFNLITVYWSPVSSWHFPGSYGIFLYRNRRDF